MIAKLTGTLDHLDLTAAIVDVGGVGYEVSIPLSTHERLPKEGDKLTLHIHHHITEGGMTLFGFASIEEKELFRLLMTVNGVGPKLALSVLSCMPAANFRDAVASGDIKALSRVSGVGKKTAERLVLELKDKISGLVLTSSSGGGAPRDQAVEDAYLALCQLGFKPETARKAAQSAAEETPERERTSENLIRLALGRCASAQ